MPKVIRTRDEAIAEINDLLARTDQLKSVRRYSAEHTEWLIKTLSFLEDVFGRQSRYYRIIATLTWEYNGAMLVGGMADPFLDMRDSIEHQHHQAYMHQIDTAKGVLKAALSEIECVDEINTLYEGKNTPPETSLIVKVINLGEQRLRKVIREIPAREKDVQDAFEDLLIGADIPYSRESEHIEYSSKTYVPDFVIEMIDLAIDMKLCGRDGREKEIISEINDDIMAYQTRHANLLFLVYDTGNIRDIDRFITSFHGNERVIVRVIKH
jgi:hypothetical protein